MKLRNLIGIVLVVISLGLLIPGLTQPLLTITASAKVFGQDVEMFRDTRSILQTIENLHESGDDFVAVTLEVESTRRVNARRDHVDRHELLEIGPPGERDRRGWNLRE